jgi:hypothetical protein
MILRNHASSSTRLVKTVDNRYELIGRGLQAVHEPRPTGGPQLT